MFQRALDHLGQATVKELIILFQEFEDHREYFEQNIEEQVKKKIIDEVDRATANEMVTLMNIFRNDEPFRKFLAHNLLERY
jgi:hypothetical protein